MKKGLMEDNDLVKNCLEGDVDSFHEIMTRYQGYAMAVALNILMNYEDAQDACQSAFLKTFHSLDRFDFQKTFKNWFYALLCNHCLDQLRRKKRFFKVLRRLEDEIPSSLERTKNQTLSISDELSMLKHLSPKERIALYLWSQEGYSGSEVASVLQCSDNTAYVHLHHARKKIKSLLKEKENGRM
jgi:RNA polymerase sigma-70 factor (ECF subfamily)